MKEKKLAEKIISAEVKYQGRILTVENVDVELPNGRRAARDVVRHLGAAAVVPVDDQGRVYFVRQYRTAIEKELLEIPAGKLNFRGEDRLEAAKRELQEETGFEAGQWTHLMDIATTPGFSDEIIGLYLARDLRAGQMNPDEDEFLAVESMPLAEAIDLVRRGEIEDAKTACALMAAWILIEK